MNSGFIYIRKSELWDLYNAYKLGKTSNIIDREQTYITGEVKRGSYKMIIELDLFILDNIEKELQIYFNKFNLQIKFNAGTEFYKKEIIKYIIPYFEENNIKHKILSASEIENLIRKTRINDNNATNVTTYKPRDYQKTIIEKSIKYFENNAKGLLIIPCGVGKTPISLWITQKININTILIGVPNKLLLKQWQNTISVLFKNADIEYLTVSGGVNVTDIINFLDNNQKKCIVITTYASAHKIYSATQKTKFVFGMKILDEAHHLTATRKTNDTAKKYIQILNICSAKQLSLTATIKLLEGCNDNTNTENIISNDDVVHFGEIIEKKSLLWAIDEKIICDYVIQTIITNEEQFEEKIAIFNIVEENNKRLFSSAYTALKSIFEGHSHHLLIYSNNRENSTKIIQYIKILLENKYFNLPELFYENYHSEMNSREQKKILNKFEKAVVGIICCVYCLGEGWDFPLLDAVVFAENMNSNIRIVQSALRASRKNKHQPNKITKIILPIYNKGDFLENNNNPDLKKVREVIYQMGLEDENITQKIKVFKINIEKQTSHKRKDDDETDENKFGEYDEEFTKKLILKTIKRTILGTTYEKARKIIADKCCKTKQEYYKLCEKDNRLPEEPENVFKGQFTNWIDYLSIELKYYSLVDCIQKVNEYLILHSEIKKHYLDLSSVCCELCKKDELFPPNGLWVEYYNVNDLKDIIEISNRKKRIPSNII